MLALGSEVVMVGCHVPGEIVAVTSTHYTVRWFGGMAGTDKCLHDEVCLFEADEIQHEQFMEKVRDRLG